MRLVALFTLVPLVELYLLLWLGTVIGFWPTVGIVLTTALVGGFLAKREGLRVWNEWQKALSEMRIPEDGIISGLLVLVGGVLLVTPGVLTDITGLCLLFPPTRRVIARWLEGYAEKRFRGASVMDVRVAGPRGVYAKRRVVDADGAVVEEREVVQEPGQPAREVVRGPALAPDVVIVPRRGQPPREEREDEVLEGEVLDTHGRRLS